MARLAAALAEHPAFAALPVRRITLERAGEEIAVHLAGRPSDDRPAVLCLPGYNRNMSDFAAFVPVLQRALNTDWPVVLMDLRGRGRSTYRRRADDYSTTSDARDVSIVARALGIGSAIVLGQGHGGQVAMALARERPTLLAGVILIDAGPVASPHSLVRLRNNANTIAGVRGDGLKLMLRRMAGSDYPEITAEEHDRLAARTHAMGPDGRALPLYDGALIRRLNEFAHDDVLLPQWAFFDLLRHTPMMLLRTELTDQLPAALFDEMTQRRPDAQALVITRQGSPALLDRADEAGAIAGFIRRVTAPAASRSKRT